MVRKARCDRAVKGKWANVVGEQNECHSQLRYGSNQQWGDFYMRTPKYYLYLTDEEYRLVLQSLVSIKNSLIREGRYTDAVDELIIKLSKAKKKKVRIA